MLVLWDLDSRGLPLPCCMNCHCPCRGLSFPVCERLVVPPPAHSRHDLAVPTVRRCTPEGAEDRKES